VSIFLFIYLVFTLFTYFIGSLAIPFLRLGESISGGPHFPLTKDALKLVATGQASSEILLAILHAVRKNNCALYILSTAFIGCFAKVSDRYLSN
jgi:hypothetical protein